MYKFYIKKLNTSRELYEPYTEATPIETDADNEITEIKTVYSTDDLDELADKYKELLVKYTTEQIKVVEELDVEMLVTIED